MASLRLKTGDGDTVEHFDSIKHRYSAGKAAIVAGVNLIATNQYADIAIRFQDKTK